MSRRSHMFGRVDAEVGEKIRARRKLLGMSQSVLASTLGVSFQQIQKYEKGTNTASADRLQELSHALGIPVSSLFESVEPFVPMRPILAPGEDPDLFKHFTSPEGIELNRAFAHIVDPRLRNCVVALVRAIAEKGDE